MNDNFEITRKCTCGTLVKSRFLINSFDGTYAFHCSNCGLLFLAGIDDTTEVVKVCRSGDNPTHKEEIPNFQLGDKVMLVDVNHAYFMQTGMVIGLKHKFIRVRFDNPEHTVIWMSDLVIARMPK